MMWQTQTTIEYPFALRPASIEEAGLFYSQMDEAEDAVLGTVGHIRMDFGASGKEFYHTWWPHNGDQFNTGEFKDELQKFVDMLRSDGPLTNLASMRNYCYQHGGKITEDGRCFGYIAETEHYRYCLRCTPSPGEYQGYLYSYDLRQQRMAQQAKPVGRITYASGEEQTFTQDNDLEKLWNKFSRTPLGPDGQPLAISDVVELYNASGSTFFYIDRYGFQPIEFVDHPSQDQSMSMTL